MEQVCNGGRFFLANAGTCSFICYSFFLCLGDFVGVAQVDAFELLYTSEDDPEGAYGHEFSPSDFKYIGYRVIQPKDVADCDYLLEFSFTTWEKQKRLNLEFFQVSYDILLCSITLLV